MLKKSLVWLRNDIRMDDNPAIQNAFAQSELVHVIYLFSKKQLKLHNESDIKISFLIENLRDIASSLDELNVGLSIIETDGFSSDPQEIVNFFEDNNFDKLFFNNTFGVDENNRDAEIIKIFKDKNYEFENFDDQVLFKPGSILTNEGKPYSVFTPFKRKWLEFFNLELLDIEYAYSAKNKKYLDSNIDNFDFYHTFSFNAELWRVGEKGAKFVLDNFLESKSLDYNINRNDPIKDGTSRISPYLALGILSSRRCILEGIKINNLDLYSGNKGILKWIDEIVWREFYRNIMHAFPKVSMGKPFQAYTDNINWRYNDFEFTAWQTGNTGFPIIDAAIRQMLNEGWMHNRLRMVVAMFFTKNMLHDWRLGEKFFMENLIDADFSSNNGGWQWSASTGTDAAPYFRIFNPITQSKNFDKNGEFIKKFIPELKDLDASVIHEPPANIRDHLNYPQPILDLKESRLRAIEAFKNAKDFA